MPISRDRARGAFLGLAVSDALGTTLEFSRPRVAAFPALASGPHREITGGGPFRLEPGQVTDDSQMAIALASSLAELDAFDVEDVARRYIAWMAWAFDVGSQTRAALQTVPKVRSPEEAGRLVWLASGKNAAGNGSLMRTAPIGVFFADRPDLRRLASLADSSITHFDYRCQIACAALNAAIGAALASEAVLTAKALLVAAGAEIEESAGLLADRWSEDAPLVEQARADLLTDLKRAQADDPELLGRELHVHNAQGFVRVAFRLAFWTLCHAPTFEAGIVAVVNLGGDSDTNGAVAGALLGAVYGESAIPEKWTTAVLDALQDGPPSPLRDTYHPRRLLDLARDPK